MHEIEVKILEVDVSKVRARLAAIGAVKVFEGIVDASHYELKGRQGRLGKRGVSLRLRTKGDYVELAAKKKLQVDGVKARDEFEIVCSDREAMERILELVGLRKTDHITKHRVSYEHGTVKYEFDTLPDIPTLLEIEAKSVTALRRAVANVGYRMRDTVPYSTNEVLRHYAGR